MAVCVSVRSEVGHSPVEGAFVVLEPSQQNQPSLESATDASGRAAFDLDTASLHTYRIIVYAANFEPISIQALPRLFQTVTLSSLPKAVNRIGWWHQALGLNSYQHDRGAGIRIGVIDSGCIDHPDLMHVVDCGAVVDSVFGPRCADDVGHGTGVTSLIAARPDALDNYSGFVPGSEVYSIKAFDVSSERGALQSGTTAEVNTALFELMRREVDLINCSFAADTEPALQLATEDLIAEAFDRGVLCICAAGNKPIRAHYPASSPHAVSVSAVGLRGTVRNDTFAAREIPPLGTSQWAGDYFVPRFTARGAKIDCCSWGIGLLAPSQLPGAYISVFGTSFAAPLVTGVLAASLSLDQTYLNLPRTAARSAHAFKKLQQICVPTGLPKQMAGAGLPMLTP